MNICIVEDNPDHLELLKEGLGQHKSELKFDITEEFNDKSDILKLINRPLESFTIKDKTVFIIDINLYQYSGFQVMEALKAKDETKKIPVIFISSSNDELDKCLDNQAAGFFVKPDDFEQYKRMAKNILHYWCQCFYQN